MMKTAAATAAALAASTQTWAQPFAAYGGQSGLIFDPRRYGAKGDGVTLDTQPIQQAIDDCTAAGGGTVLLGPGTYVTGLVRLKSNVTFQLQAGAKILASPNYSDFVLPADAVAITKVSVGAHLLFALNAQNITILGPGTIDGNSPNYIVAKPRPPVAPQDQWRDVAAFGTQRVHQISPMVEMGNVTNLHVENITLQNAVGWALRPIGCKQVLIRKVTVRNPINSSNCDGIDPQACEDVLLDGCDIVTGDDAICVKSGNFYQGNQASRNVKIMNCRVSTCTNGLIIGPEGPAPIVNTTFENCEVYGTSGPENERPTAGAQVMLWDNSYVDGVTYSGIKMTNVRAPICIRLQTTAGKEKLAQANTTPLTGAIRNVTITNVQATGATITSSITGIPQLQPQNITLRDISITTVEPGNLAWLQNPVPEAATSYPGSTMFGRLPAYGLYAHHVQGLTLQNVTITSQTHDPRPMLVCDDVKQLSVQDVSGTPSDPSQPFMDLRNTQSARIQGNRAPVGTGVFVKVSGANSHDVQMQGNDFSQSKSPVMRTLEVPQDGVGSVN
jgi:polygalacturonase